jgi:Leucine-rich repeat (LRR) protein
MSTLVILDLAGNYLGGTIPVNLFNNSQKPMKFVYLQSNHLRGRIPDSIGESLQLQQVFLFKNSLTGSLPTNMVKLNRLQTLLVQDNELNGWPGPAVKSIGYPHSPPQMMSALQIVDLSNNLFTGPVPTQLFELPNIRYVSITEGCFEGSLPQAVCSAPTMTHLILEGLTSGRGCATPIWDPLGLFAQGFIYGRGLDGGIPTCLFQHANLTTLHLSGNGLDGSISAPSEPKALKDLSIAYNQLSGTIPVNLLQSSYSSFDLSNNKISGTCDDMKQWTQSDTGTNSLLSLSFNRLSGNIPTVFRGLDHIDILDGNIFDCPNRNTNLPKQDPNYSTYICASDDYDEMLIIWVSFLGCLLFVFAVAFVVYVVSTKTSTISPFEGFKKSIDIWIGNIKLWNHHANSVCTVKTPEIHDFLVFLKLLRAFTFKLAVFILILFSSVYISMKMVGESGTHSYQYRWTPSAAYLSGTLAATLLVVAVLLIICFTFYSIMKFRTDIEATSSSRAISIHRVSSTAAVSGYFIQNGVDGIWNKAYIITISGFLINAVVVLVVNGIYVYLVMWRDLSTSSVLGIQIGKSIFDILWNNVALRLFMKNIKKSLHIKRLVRLVLAMLIFNTIVAPILSSLVTDSNCFVGMFVENHAISTTTTLGYCNKLVKVNITNTDDTVAQCEVYGTLTLETSYVPKFQYNYQCSSSFLSNFIPIFVFTLGSGTFIVPVLQVIMSYVLTHKVSPDMLPVIPPRAFFPGVTLHRIPNHHVFSTDMVVARLLQNITMMLTFGLACPNLAFIIGVHVYVMTWFNHLLLGRYLAMSKGRDSVSDVKKESEAVQNPMTRSPMMQSVDKNVTLNDVKVDASNIPMTEILENDCRGITLAPEVAMRTIIDTSSIVMAILLIDVSGDANGLVAALLTASLPVLCIPVLLRIFHRRYLAMYSENTQVTDDMSIVSSTLSNSSYFSGGESIMNHERDRKLSKAQAEAQARFDI